MFGSMQGGGGGAAGGGGLKAETLDPRTWMQQTLPQIHHPDTSG